jgi:hypothetical protein
MSQLQVNRINDASGGVLAPISSVMRNRIINGAMVIDQRNAGAAVSGNGFPVDRWNVPVSQSSKLTAQQNAGAVTPPAGFTNYAGVTSSSAYSVISSDFFLLGQRIEGFNVADLGWGTANAKTVTLSFWVRSSLTGAFGGSLQNSAQTRTYPYSYTISAANTWEYKTVTIAGDTTGTWLTTNGVGVTLWFSLGVGSSNTGTAGAWAGSSALAPTGSTSVVGTNGATFYITGVQLEVGTQATSFEYRQYQQELALCQRYFRTVGRGGSATPMSVQGAQYLDGTTIYLSYLADLTNMRALPTATLNGTANTDYAVYNSSFSPQTGFTIGLGVYSGFTGYQIQASKSSHGLSNTPQLFFGSATSLGFVSLSSEL